MQMRKSEQSDADRRVRAEIQKGKREGPGGAILRAETLKAWLGNRVLLELNSWHTIVLSI